MPKASKRRSFFAVFRSCFYPDVTTILEPSTKPVPKPVPAQAPAQAPAEASSPVPALPIDPVVAPAPVPVPNLLGNQLVILEPRPIETAKADSFNPYSAAVCVIVLLLTVQLYGSTS